MPIYVYKNLINQEVTEVLAPTYEPSKYLPGPDYVLVIQPSLVVFGDFLIGDDDFSRRWHLNGEAGANGGKGNATQGKTNVNAVLRKWGKNGQPLEARTDIDSTKITKGGKRPPGVESSLEAPPSLRSSDSPALSLSDLR